MEDRSDPERIDIELISAEVVHRRPHHRHGHRDVDAGRVDDEPAPVEAVIRTFEPDGPDGESGPEPDPGRRRLIGITSVVGVLALVLGFTVGRLGGGDRVATTDTTGVPGSTMPATTTTFLSGEAIPRVQPTTTVRPTTTLPAPITGAIELDPRLAGIDLTLVGRHENTLVDIDLAEQTIVELQLPWTGGDPSSLVVGDDWVLFGDGGGGRSTVVYDDGTSEPVFLGDWWQPLWIVGTDRFWRADGSATFSAPDTFSEVDLNGEPTGSTIEIPTGTAPWMVDPRGGLVVEVAGGVYSIGESSVELIGSGDLLGLSIDTAVFRTCDAQLRCGVTVVDRRSGEQRTVELDPALYVESAFYFGGSGGSMVSPDGGYCAAMMMMPDDSYQPGLIDLDTGAVTGLNGDFAWGPSNVVWSPDGRFAFFVRGTRIQALDLATGEEFAVFETDSFWSALGARPDGS